MKARWIALGVGLVVLGGVVCQAVAKGKGKPVAVRTEKPALRSLAQEVSGPARIRPSTEVKLSADNMGRVVRVGVREGERVRRGQFLLQLDPVPYEFQVARARAEVDQAKAALEQYQAQLRQASQELERMEKLAHKELVAPETVQQQRTQVEVLDAQVRAAVRNVRRAEAVLKSAEDALSRTTFTSPIDGIVSRVNVEEGEMAVVGTMNNPGTVLLQIAALDSMEAEVEVDETEVVDIRPGQPAQVTLEAFPDTALTGVVSRVSPSATVKYQGSPQEVVVFPVVVLLTGRLPDVRPGMTGTARIQVASRDSVLSIPISSLVVRDPVREERRFKGEEEPEVTPDQKPVEREGVYVVDRGKARFLPLETGISGVQYIEVKAGLPSDAVVVSGPFETLRELKSGTRVRTLKGVKP